MRRRVFLLAGAVATTMALGAPAAAQSSVDAIVTQLRSQGFEVLSIRRTLLGRSRIVAERPDGRREVVVNPRNGVVLRDFFYVREDKDDREEQDEFVDEEDLDEDFEEDDEDFDDEEDDEDFDDENHDDDREDDRDDRDGDEDDGDDDD